MNVRRRNITRFIWSLLLRNTLGTAPILERIVSGPGPLPRRHDRSFLDRLVISAPLFGRGKLIPSERPTGWEIVHIGGILHL